ncbi:MAG: hypothetical protein HY076_06820, partial [Candidatus Eisenbacteria bacterium]|nr:hypothetical protein [Candidatus Eisenbacteria bacterium]
QDFAAFLAAEKLPATPAEIAAEHAVLDRALRRELTRRAAGDAAAMRVALDGDPVFERALLVLSRARTPREVFALAAPESRTAPARGAAQEHAAHR